MPHLLRRAAFTGIALAAALGIPSPAYAGHDKAAAGTVSIENGGSSAILSWAWGLTNSTTIGSGSGGAGSGKVTLQNFNITKRIDPLSTELTQAVATGSHFTKVFITTPIGGPGTPFSIKYTLQPVFVQSLQQSGSADGATESVAFAYGSFKQEIGNTSPFGWAKRRHKK